MSRKANQLRKRLAISDAKVRRIDRECNDATRAAMQYRSALTRADAQLSAIFNRSKVRVEETFVDPNQTAIRVVLSNYELEMGAEELIDHTARKIAVDLMKYAVENKIIKDPPAFQAVPEGPRVRDFDYLSPGTAYTRPRL